MITVVNKLSPEDLNRYRMRRATLDACEINPSQFDKDATYKAVLDHYKILGELTEQYNLPVMSDIDPATGVCTVEYEFEQEA